MHFWNDDYVIRNVRYNDLVINYVNRLNDMGLYKNPAE